MDGHFLSQNPGDRSAEPLIDLDVIDLEMHWTSPPTMATVYFYGFDDLADTSPQCKYEQRIGWDNNNYYNYTETKIQHLFVQIGCGQNIVFDQDDYFTITLSDDSEFDVHFPNQTIQNTGGMIGFWIAQDGSTYWARRLHETTPSFHTPQMDPYYAMRYARNASGVYNGLAGSANDTDDNDSPALDSGDPTMHSLATTNINQSMDNSAIDAGYHYGGYAYGNIRSNAIVEFYDDTLHLQEDSGVVDFYVVRTGAEDIEFSIDYHTVAGSAGPPIPPDVPGDYQPAQGTVTFEPYETFKVIPITIIDNSEDEAEDAETFSVQISLSSGSQNVTLGGNTEATAQQSAHEQGQPGPTPTPTPGWAAQPEAITASIDFVFGDQNRPSQYYEGDLIWVGANLVDIDTYLYNENGTPKEIKEKQEVESKWYTWGPNDNDYVPLGVGTDKGYSPFQAFPMEIGGPGEYKVKIEVDDTSFGRVNDPPIVATMVIQVNPTPPTPTPTFIPPTCYEGIWINFGAGSQTWNPKLALHGWGSLDESFAMNLSVAVGASGPPEDISRYHIKHGDPLPTFLCSYGDNDSSCGDPDTQHDVTFKQNGTPVPVVTPTGTPPYASFIYQINPNIEHPTDPGTYELSCEIVDDPGSLQVDDTLTMCTKVHEMEALVWFENVPLCEGKITDKNPLSILFGIHPLGANYDFTQSGDNFLSIVQFLGGENINEIAWHLTPQMLDLIGQNGFARINWNGWFANGARIVPDVDLFAFIFVGVNDHIVANNYQHLVDQHITIDWAFNLGHIDTTPILDLDVDSNNDGIVCTNDNRDPSNTDDAIETAWPGKLIYLNRDNDNNNTKVRAGVGPLQYDDVEDRYDFNLTANDDDLQEMTINLDPRIPDGATLRLEAESGGENIAIWLSRQKKPGEKVEKTSTPGFADMEWTIYTTPPPSPPNPQDPTPVPIPDKVYIEGIHTGGTTGETKLKISVIAGSETLAEDMVMLGVVNGDYPVSYEDVTYGYDDGDYTIPHPYSSDSNTETKPHLCKAVSNDANSGVTKVFTKITPKEYTPFVFFTSSDNNLMDVERDDKKESNALYASITSKAAGHAHVIARLGTETGAAASWLRVAAYSNQSISARYYYVHLPGKAKPYDLSFNVSTILGVLQQGVVTCEFQAGNSSSAPYSYNYDTDGDDRLDSNEASALRAYAEQNWQLVTNEIGIFIVRKAELNGFPGLENKDVAGFGGGSDNVIGIASNYVSEHTDYSNVIAHELGHCLGLHDLDTGNSDHLMYYEAETIRLGWSKYSRIGLFKAKHKYNEGYESGWDTIIRPQP